jgi:hypothetical protein
MSFAPTLEATVLQKISKKSWYESVVKGASLENDEAAVQLHYCLHMNGDPVYLILYPKIVKHDVGHRVSRTWFRLTQRPTS